MCIVEFSKARSHVDKILLNLPSLISSASVSSYQLIQLVSINLYAMFHSRRRGGVSSATELADDNIVPLSLSYHNGDATYSEISAGTPSTSAQSVLYDKLMFTFTGLYVCLSVSVSLSACLSVCPLTTSAQSVLYDKLMFTFTSLYVSLYLSVCHFAAPKTREKLGAP